jgi:hypothetical protein
MKIPDDYINLSDLAAKHGKVLRTWANYPVGKKKIAAFAASHPDIKEPLITKRGKGGGTYAHPELAAIFAVWCDPSFAGFQQKMINMAAQTMKKSLTKDRELAFKKALYGKLFGQLPKSKPGDLSRENFQNSWAIISLELFFENESAYNILNMLDRYEPESAAIQLSTSKDSVLSIALKQSGLTRIQQKCLIANHVKSDHILIEYNGCSTKLDIPKLKNANDWVEFAESIAEKKATIGVLQ